MYRDRLNLVSVPLGLLISSALLGGCSSSSSATDSTDDAIVHGQQVFTAEFNAVVRLNWSTGAGYGTCSGVLVAPRIVLTAAHCVQTVDVTFGGQSTSILGETILFDGYHGHDAPKYATAWVESVLRFGVAARQRDDFPGFGIDVALIMLKDAIPAEVAIPIPVRATPLTQADVGKALTIAGFGVGGVRKVGKQKLMAVSGKPFQQMFDSRSAFGTYVSKHEPYWADSEIDDLWNDELYAYGQEVQTWGDPFASEDFYGLASQACSGDSGGPLLERVGNGYNVVGIISNGTNGSGGQNDCLLGARIARIGDQVIDAIAERVVAKDPVSVLACPSDPTPHDHEDNYEDTACAANDLLVACRSDDHDRQRVERCQDRGLHCSVVKGVADCR